VTEEVNLFGRQVNQEMAVESADIARGQNMKSSVCCD